MAKPYFTREVYFANPEGIYFVEKARRSVLFLVRVGLQDLNKKLGIPTVFPVSKQYLSPN